MGPARAVVHKAARRALRSAPPALREIAFALAARAADGPGLLPGPPPGPVLVVAPHPDDETIGCGGALARHADRGDAVTVVVASSGERTRGRVSRSTGDAREAECTAACRDLGLAGEPVFLRLPDGGLASQRADLAAGLLEHGRGARVVYAPGLLDPHRDHRAVNAAVALAGLGADVYGYEVWSAGPIDALLDVTDVFDRKVRALQRYATALRTVDYVRTARGLAAYRSGAGGLGGEGFAEGFVCLDAALHAELVRRGGLLDPA